MSVNDLIVFSIPIAVYFLILFFISYKLRLHGHTEDEDYFLAGRKIGKLQSIVSVVATETSVASIIVFPAAGYSSGWTVLWLASGYIIGRILVARFHLQRLYNTKSVSIYSEMASDSVIAHDFLGASYLLAKFISSGVRFFMGGFSLNQLFGGGILLWMAIIALIVGIYSLSGGLKAVVFTDQIQGYIILFMGIILISVIIHDFSRIPQSIFHNFPQFYDLRFSDFTNPSFSPAFFLGGMILSIGTHGADQDMLQRILAVKNLAEARRSLVVSGFGAFIVIFLYSSVGILLRYTGLELEAKSPLIGWISGYAGPFLSGLFAVLIVAAAMSTMDSAIHSTGAVWKVLFRSRRNGRGWSFLSLVILFLFGAGTIEIQNHYQDFLGLAMGSMNYVNGGLIGIVTVHALYPGRLRPAGIVLALILGFVSTLTATWIIEPKIGWSWVVLISASSGFFGAILPALFRR